MRIAAILAVGVALSACGLTGAVPAATPVAGTTNTTPQRASGPRITRPPVSPPAPPTSVAAFKCADATGGVAGNANLTSVRLEQIGFDRLVLQFDTKVPTYAVKRQAKPVFKNGGSGQSVTLSGAAGVLVQIHSATASGSYSGTVDIVHADYQVLVEARIVQDFEGYLSWGLGLTKAACFRAFTLSDPPRLVIDFKSA